ncbi:MAG: hypothetical protein WC551_02325 [Patescibacteria group bacterium]
MMDVQRMNDRIPGKQPGLGCERCHNGWLYPVVRVESGGGDVIGGPRGWQRSMIDHLVCTSCSLTFEVCKELRGVDLDRHLQDQLDNFQNPKEKPEVCQWHDHTKLAEGHKTKEAPFRRHESRIVATYLYCDVCFKVYWAEKHEPKRRHLDDL